MSRVGELLTKRQSVQQQLDEVEAQLVTLRSDLRGIAEQLGERRARPGALQERVDSVQQRQELIARRSALESLETELAGESRRLRLDLDANADQVRRLQARIAAVETRADALKRDLADGGRYDVALRQAERAVLTEQRSRDRALASLQEMQQELAQLGADESVPDLSPMAGAARYRYYVVR